MAEICPSERKPSPALSCGVNDTRHTTAPVRAETAPSQLELHDSPVSQVGLEDVTSGPMVIGEPGADLSGIDMLTAAVHAVDADKENNRGLRPTECQPSR